MVRWVREYSELSRPKKILVGIIGTAFGVLFSIYGGLEVGIPIDKTLQNVIISGGLGIVAAYVYGFVVKRGKIKP